MALDYAKYASNSVGVVTEPLNYTHPQAPTEKTYHGIAISINGAVVGRVQSWNNKGGKTREASHVYELNNRTFGRPVDVVPGVAKGYTIAASALELWGKEIEFILGSSTRYIDLVSQTAPFTAEEFWHRGSNPYETWTYLGCWMTDMDQSEFKSDGDAKVTTNVNFTYTARMHIQHSI
ncbi:MAG: hypothetical protein WC505_06920 [Patescibacteria group bacterium]